jgi:hypothetical protein
MQKEIEASMAAGVPLYAMRCNLRNEGYKMHWKQQDKDIKMQ